jgi:hypothetical protein
MQLFNLEEDRERHNLLYASLAPKLMKCVVPIVARNQNRQIGQCGTGTLLQVADSFFLVTAAHVLREAKKHGLQLLLPM